MCEERHGHGQLEKAWHSLVGPGQGTRMIQAILRREGTTEGVGRVHLHVHVVSKGVNHLVRKVIIYLFATSQEAEVVMHGNGIGERDKNHQDIAVHKTRTH